MEQQSNLTLHQSEVREGKRFAFGRNWSKFLYEVDEERLEEAHRSLRRLLDGESLEGKSLVDVGSGSGIFSLAARRLGMNVLSFDFDPDSVACTVSLKQRYFEHDERWSILEGSVLDEAFVRSLGRYDVVYAWGVLHHTGDMWRALEAAGMLVMRNGRLIIAIYNDQGPWSRFWKKIKFLYNKLPNWLRIPYVLLIVVVRELKIAFVPLLKLKPHAYLALWKKDAGASGRGMSRWYDYLDWIGGYPFEVAKPEEIFDFYRSRGFELEHLKTCAGELGCNEFVFRRTRGDGLSVVAMAGRDSNRQNSV